MSDLFEIEACFPENEYWQWVEVYEDKVICQFDENGVSRHFHDIDQDNLVKFVMIHRDPEQVKPLTIPITNGRRLIHFYRGKKLMSIDGTEKRFFRAPVVGYQETKNGTNFKVLMMLHDNGEVVVIVD